MSKFDDLFDVTAPDDSLFADTGALDPLAEPEEIYTRDAQERELATTLNGVHGGYLPPTVAIYGPPGTGKTSLNQLVILDKSGLCATTPFLVSSASPGRV